jgi:hypothetical protein
MNADKFKMLKCAPGKNNNNNKVKDSCYTDEDILNIREAWNDRHPDMKITSGGTHEIWNELKMNMQDVCNNESCWLRQTFKENNIGSELTSYTFAPKSPKTWIKNPREWLSSLDIEKVMKQYEKSYPNFDFMGPSPIDFDTKMMTTNGKKCVWEELCNFDLKKQLGKGKRKIGIIFNTDTHDLGGSHWISLFINIKQEDNYIFYFDSNGNLIPKEINKLSEKIIKQAQELGIPDLKLYKNTLEHQKTNTECGMYCLYIIISLLEDKNTYKQIMKERIKDEDVAKLRSEYFNKEL